MVWYKFEVKKIKKNKPIAAGCQFRYHNPASPSLQVSLSGHLAARSILMHLSYALYLPAAAQTHIWWGLHICSVIYRHCNKNINKCLSASGVRSRVLYVSTKTIHSNTSIPIPLRGVLGAGANTGPWASTCPSGPAPDLVVTSA